MKKQHILNQRGEIEFRKKLFLQQVEGEQLFRDEFDSNDILDILDQRMQRTREQMSTLMEKGVSLSPYVEIGAERCQRSLVMENDLGANGAAVDISYDILKSCTHYKKVFNKSKSPLRICCDANNLPFSSGSIPFVFCYETLHHFPAPLPITREIHGALSPGGHFFFDEEPYKRILHVDVYNKRKMYSGESLNRGVLRKLLDYFFGRQNCNELDYNILENIDISIGQWKRSLAMFNEKDINLKALGFMETSLFNPTSRLHYYLAYLLGGHISGLCRKSGEDRNKHASIRDVLVCPSCKETGREAPLKGEEKRWVCSECFKTYPVKEGVSILLSHGKFEKLYPALFKRFQKDDHP